MTMVNGLPFFFYAAFLALLPFQFLLGVLFILFQCLENLFSGLFVHLVFSLLGLLLLLLLLLLVLVLLLLLLLLLLVLLVLFLILVLLL